MAIVVNGLKRRLRTAAKELFNLFGLSLHRKEAIDRALRELDRLRTSAAPLDLSTPLPPPLASPAGHSRLRSDYERALQRLDHYESQRPLVAVTPDDDLDAKQRALVANIAEFGRSDFAEVSG